jgi:hypothetical protein
MQRHSEPIDILSIAFARYYEAQRQWAWVQMMPGAVIAAWPAADGGTALLLRAIIGVREATEDMEAARALFEEWWTVLHEAT